MKIRNKPVLVYDIEVFQNIFHCTVKNTETNELFLFEISERKNQLSELVKFFKHFDNQVGSWDQSYTTDYQFDTDVIFAGYNNIHYDNPIINYIIDFHKVMLKMSYSEICASLFKLSNLIIQSTDTNFSS